MARRVRSEDDYLVAGRRLGYPLTIFSFFATWFGAETCIASAGRTYREGLTLTNAEPFAYGLCLIIMGLVFAVPLWRRRLTTLADLFRTRYSPGVERLAALVMIPSSLFWAGAQLRGFAHVLTTVTSLNLSTAIAVAAGLCVLYTVLGGLLADAVTDLVQGVVIVAGLAVLCVAVVQRLGGPAELLASLEGARIAAVPAGADASVLGLIEEWAVPICGSVVAAELVSRAIAARSPEVARNGAVVAGGLYIVVGLLPVLLGLAAAGLVAPLEDPEGFLPALAQTALPTGLYVLFAGALVSAILSTVDTILLVSGGIAAHNLVAPALGVSDERARLRLARTGVLVLGGVAYGLAMTGTDVAGLVEQASAFGSAGVLVAVTFGLFGRSGGPLAASAALLGGLTTYLAASFGGAPYPFLASLLASICLYAAGAALESPGSRAGAGAAGR